MKRAKIMMAALVLAVAIGLLPKTGWAGNVAVGIFLGIPFPVFMVEAPPVYVHPPYAYTAYPYTYVASPPVRAYFYGFPFYRHHYYHSHGYYHGKKSGYHSGRYTPPRGGQKVHGNNRQGHRGR